LNTLVLPPFTLLVLIAVGLGLVKRNRRVGLSLAWTGFGLLTLSSLPLFGGFLLFSLQGYSALDFTSPSFPEAEAIVVLGGDQVVHAPELEGPAVGPLTLERLRYAARLARKSELPVLTSGGHLQAVDRPLAALMADCMRDDLGVEVRWIEGRSGNTIGNARGSAEILRVEGISRIYLVTHAWHMPRARACFVAQDLEVVCAPMGFRRRPPLDPGDFMPSAKGLRETSFALYEWLGRAWYELRYL